MVKKIVKQEVIVNKLRVKETDDTKEINIMVQDLIAIMKKVIAQDSSNKD